MKTIEIKKNENHKHGKSWAKMVTNVDFNQRGGYSFVGDFIPVESSVNVEDGAVILHVEHRGSQKNGEERATVYVVTEAGLQNIGDLNKGNYGYSFRGDFGDIQNVINSLLS